MDLTDIKDKVAKVISYSQDIQDPKVDELIDNWYEAKKDFIEAFGGIWYETPEPVKFDLTPEEKELRVRSFVSSLEDDYDLYGLANFIEFNIKSFFDNEVTNIPEAVAYDTRYKKIKVGMKLLKAFKYFIDDDRELLDTIQTEASRIIQEDKIEGYMRLSVHPLDFLSASENTYNWRSCHALNGDYRCGNLSYMCDKSTVMVYITTKEDKKLPRFPESVLWNSKKWRMLLHFSNNWDMIFAGRQYPFQALHILDYVLVDLLQHTKIKNNDNVRWGKWTNYQIKKVNDPILDLRYSLNESYIPVMGRLTPIGRIVQDAKNAHHFNDILYSSVYTPYYTKRIEIPKTFWDDEYELVFSDRLEFDVGSEIKCLKCGEKPIIEYGTMLCPNCNHSDENFEDYYTKCSVCGEYEYFDSIGYIDEEGQVPVCRDCRKKLTRCIRCDRLYLEKDLTYNKFTGEVLCYKCLEETKNGG